MSNALSLLSATARAARHLVLVGLVGLALPVLGAGGLIGEDVRGPDGLLVTVNSLSRTAYSGGLTAQNKEDLVDVSFSLTNTGGRPITVDPLQDFALTLGAEYKVVTDKGRTSLSSQFTVQPGATSRGNILFRVASDDQKAVPYVLFVRGSESVHVCCDEQMARRLERSKTTITDPEEAVKLSRFLREAERFDEAERVMQPVLLRFGDLPGLLLEAAAVARGLRKNEDAAGLLGRVRFDAGLGKEDALELARQAFELGQYDLSQRILEPLAQAGSLTDSDLLFLGRCWYFTKQYQRAEELLNDLATRGMQKAQLYFTLGNIADKRESYRPAITWWQKALALDPRHVEAMFNSGVAYYKLEDKDNARQCWKRVLDMQPDAEIREITEKALQELDTY